MTGYYEKKRESLLKKFKKFSNTVSKYLAETYGGEFALKICYEALEEFNDIIPRIPHYEGIINPFNELMIVGARMVAFHKPMKRHGKSAEETVLIFYDIVDALFKKTPPLFLHLGRKFVFGPLFLGKMKRVSARMTAANDPQGFNFAYHKGDGIDSDWYFIAQKCGIVTFFHSEGCGDLAPYCNFVDAIQGRALKMGVRCETCLGTGDATCSEYMKEGRETIIPEKIQWLLDNRDSLISKSHDSKEMRDVV